MEETGGSNGVEAGDHTTEIADTEDIDYEYFF